MAAPVSTETWCFENVDVQCSQLEDVIFFMSTAINDLQRLKDTFCVVNDYSVSNLAQDNDQEDVLIMGVDDTVSAHIPSVTQVEEITPSNAESILVQMCTESLQALGAYIQVLDATRISLSFEQRQKVKERLIVLRSTLADWTSSYDMENEVGVVSTTTAISSAVFIQDEASDSEMRDATYLYLNRLKHQLNIWKTALQRIRHLRQP